MEDCQCLCEDLEPKEVVLTTHVTVQIVKRIFEGRLSNLTDREIDEAITKEVGCLCYWQCKLLDACMFGEKERGFWRTAFDFPKDGDEVECPGVDGPLRGVAENCGFFTFGIRVVDGEESSG